MDVITWSIFVVLESSGSKLAIRVAPSDGWIHLPIAIRIIKDTALRGVMINI